MGFFNQAEQLVLFIAISPDLHYSGFSILYKIVNIESSYKEKNAFKWTVQGFLHKGSMEPVQLYGLF